MGELDKARQRGLRAGGRLRDRIAVVTGGARGIGLAIVEAFAREGADVAVCDLSPAAETRDAMGLVERQGRRGIYVRADVSRENQVRRMSRR